ncbi:MAG: hypothetical protein WCD43_16900 [Candidatus Acidiferrales bacterium]
MAKVSYWSGSWATVSPDFEDHLVPGAVHSWIMWGFGQGDTLTITAHPGHFNNPGEPRAEETLAVENVQVEEDTSGRRVFFDVRNVGSFAVFGYVMGFGMVNK